MTYIVILVVINIVYVVLIVYDNPSLGPNAYMEFNHDSNSSKIFVFYQIAILVMRMIYTGFFAYALWRMWTSLKNVQTPNKKVNSLAFYIHLGSMVVYTIAQCFLTLAFIKAAW